MKHPYLLFCNNYLGTRSSKTHSFLKPAIQSLQFTYQQIDLSAFNNRIQDTDLVCAITLQYNQGIYERFKNLKFFNIELIDEDEKILEIYRDIDEIQIKQVNLNTPMGSRIQNIELRYQFSGSTKGLEGIDIINQLHARIESCQVVSKKKSIRLLANCSNGEFLDGICKKCSNCDFCSSQLTTNAKRECFNCLHISQQLYQRIDGSCLKGCPTGQSYNVWANFCSNGCDTDNCNCSNNECQSCKNKSHMVFPDWKTCYICDTNNGSTKLDNICLKCNNNQYIDITQKSCKGCETKYGACDTCDQNQCLKCSQNAGYSSFQKKSCVNCGMGFVKLGDYCFEQSTSCKKLSINSLKEDKKQIICDECTDSSHIKYDDGSCASTCNQKHAIYEGNCISCQNNCLECPNLVECKKCDSDKYIYDNQTCLTKQECTSLPEHYVVSLSKKCSKCDTEKGYYFKSGSCIQCHPFCRQCTGISENQCTGCYNGFQLMNNGTCFKCQIENGYYVDENQQCSKCNDECIKCNGPSNSDCITCKGALKLDPQSKKCVCAIQNCQQCSIDGTICLSCQVGFAGEQCNECNQSQGKYVENNQCKDCHSSCQTCTAGSEQDCIDCKISAFKVNQVTKLCSCEITQCQQCNNNGTSCITCEQGYTYQNQKCQLCDINNGYILKDKICSQCHTSCKKCKGLSETDCIECSQIGFKIDQNTQKCYCPFENCQQCSTDGKSCAKCNSGFTYENNQCTFCDINNGYFINTNKICQKCHQQCKECQGPAETECNSCKITSFKVDQLSKKCSCQLQNCKSCSNDGNSCLECQDNYTIDKNNSSVCRLCDTKNQFFIDSNKQCLPCHSSCQKCHGQTERDCDICMITLFSPDPKNNNLCSCKIDNCKKCNDKGSQCLYCNDNYTIKQNGVQCELNLKCEVENCSECQQNSRNLCKRCENEYLLSEKYDKCSKQINLKCQVENCQECQQNSSKLCKTCENEYSISEKNDKCSKQLKIQQQQYGFKSIQKMNKDGYLINLTFDKPINFNSNTSYDLSKVIKFNITNINDYKGQINTKSNNEIDIKIDLNQTCKYETIHIQIADDEFIQSNQLKKTKDDFELETYIKMSEEDKQISKDLETTSKSITSTLAATIIPIAILGNFSILFSMLDITGYIYYLLYLNIRYPDCINSFCSQLDNFQFAFIPNALMYFLDKDYSQWAPKKFIENESDGYFLHGAGQSFTIIFIIMSIYITLKCLSFLPIPKLKNYLNKKIKGGWEYSGFIDLIWTVYLYVLVSIFLQFYTFEIYDNSSYINYILFIICTIAVVAIPLKFFKIIHKSINIKDDDFINERLGALVGGLKLYNQDEYKHNIVEEVKKQENQAINQSQEGEQNLKLQNRNSNEKGNEDNQGQNGVANAGNEEFDINSLMQSHKCLENIKQQSSNVLEDRINLNQKTRRERLSIQLSKYTNMISYLRKFTFSFIIVYLHEYTYLQIVLFMMLSLMMGSYYLYILPHTSYFDNVKNGISEFILILILFSAALLVDDPKEQDEGERKRIGWVYIGCTALIIVVQAIDLIFELLRSLFQRIIALFRKQTAKTVPVENKTQQIQNFKRPSSHRFASQITNFQPKNSKFISSQLSLKSFDLVNQNSNLIAKQDDYNVGEIKDITINNHIYQEIDQNSPVKTGRRKRGAFTYSSRILQMLPTKSHTNLALQDQDSNIFEMSNNQGISNIASASRSYLDDNTGRHHQKK